MTRKVLTDDEMKALLAVDLLEIDNQNRRWFWIRTGFCLAYIVAMVIGLLFFRERIFAKFDLPDESAAIITGGYVHFRVAVISLMTGLYLLSYYRNWYFSYVALASLLIGIANFITDYFTIYIYAKPESIGVVALISVLRLMMIAMLYANFRFSVRASVQQR